MKTIVIVALMLLAAVSLLACQQIESGHSGGSDDSVYKVQLDVEEAAKVVAWCDIRAANAVEERFPIAQCKEAAAKERAVKWAMYEEFKHSPIVQEIVDATADEAMKNVYLQHENETLAAQLSNVSVANAELVAENQRLEDTVESKSGQIERLETARDEVLEDWDDERLAICDEVEELEQLRTIDCSKYDEGD